MLLYPTVETEIDMKTSILGNVIAIRTLDLSVDWSEIKNRLLTIAKEL